MLRTLSFVCMMIAAISTASPARAEPAATEDAREVAAPAQPAVTPVPAQAHPLEKPPPKKWYGWQNLIVDAASVGVMGAGLAWMYRGEATFAVGAGAFVLGGPVIHVAHERPVAALASLALRAGLGLGGLLVGNRIDIDACYRSGSDACGPAAGTLGGVLVGIIAASAIDATALAHETVEPERPRPQRGMSITPIVSANRQSGTVGVVGVF